MIFTFVEPTFVAEIVRYSGRGISGCPGHISKRMSQ